MQAILLILVLFVVGPLSLFLSLMATSSVVFILTGLAVMLASGHRTKTTMDTPGLVFLIFMALNGLVSGISGNAWHEVLNEVLPAAEVFFSFILVSRVPWDEAKATRALRLVLIAVSLR